MTKPSAYKQEITAHDAGPQAPLTPMDMLNRAVVQGASIEVLEKLMALQERWEANQARKAFELAITQAKAELPSITRNKTVSFGQGKTSYRHETLDHVVDTIRPVLDRYGLSFRFRTDVRDDGKVVVTCRIAHRDGYSEETSLPGPADVSGAKNAIQAIGSTVTYLQRYTLKAALGLAASDDDDGKAAGEKAGKPRVSDEQIAELEGLLEKAGVPLWKYLQAVGIGALADIYADRFEAAKGLIEAKIRAKRGG
jgi:hypothetical protein